MGRYGMNGLNGGPDHHAREAQSQLDVVDETLESSGGDPRAKDVFIITSALAKAAVHLGELPESPEKRKIGRRFNGLKTFVIAAKKNLIDSARRCGDPR